VICVVEDVIKNPVFPEKELTTFIQNKKQEFLINNEKVRHIARRMFNKQIFGGGHPYGKTAVIDDYDKVTSEALTEYHIRHYTHLDCKIIVSGMIPANLTSILNSHFGGKSSSSTETKKEKRNTEIIPEGVKVHIKKANAVQSAIRIGRPMFNKIHPDFLKLKVVNTVLGGYFGSRLMTNIREDKGYTYGIGSAIVSLRNSGYFFIASEVGSDVTELAINEVYNEIEKLQQELIGDEELNLVRNYLLGSILRNFDGPFPIAESFKSILEYGLSSDYFQNYIDTIKSITPEEIRNLTQKYFDKNNLYELIVG
jgi:predicted Zn-dependent peptidase